MSHGDRIIRFKPPDEPVEDPYLSEDVEIQCIRRDRDDGVRFEAAESHIRQALENLPQPIHRYRPRPLSKDPAWWVQFDYDELLHGNFRRIGRYGNAIDCCHWCGRSPQNYAVTVHRSDRDLRFCQQYCHDDWSFDRAVEELKRTMPTLPDE